MINSSRVPNENLNNSISQQGSSGAKSRVSIADEKFCQSRKQTISKNTKKHGFNKKRSPGSVRAREKVLGNHLTDAQRRWFQENEAER